MFKLKIEYQGKVGYISRKIFQDRYGKLKRGPLEVSESKILAEVFKPEEVIKLGLFNYLMTKGLNISIEEEKVA